MAGFSLSSVIAELEKLAAEAPDLLAKLPAMLDSFATLTAPEVALLSKWFPNLGTLEATTIGELKALVALFIKWGPTVTPWIIKALMLLNSFFGPPAQAGMTAAAPPQPGQPLPGAEYPL